MGITILSQWVDVAERLYKLHQNMRTFRRVLVEEPATRPEFVGECTRLLTEIKTIEQEVSYLQETLLQAVAILE